MAFNISLGFSGLKNNESKEEVGKTYALFIGETVIANEVGCSNTKQLVNDLTLS